MSNAEDTQKAEKFLSKIKVQILTKSTFFSTIMLSLKTSITTSVQTAATDGSSLLFNPTFLLDLTLEQGVGLMLHELEHVAFLHPSRLGTKNQKKWTYATDFAINNLLDTQGYELPPGGLLDHELDNKSAEAIYAIIDDPEDDPTPGCGDDILRPSDPDATSQSTNEILVQAHHASKMNPKPGEHIHEALERQIDKFLNPKLPWQIILQNFMQEFAKDDYTWYKPNRRFMPEFYLPSQRSSSINNLTIAVDTSGSITKEEFTSYMTEIEHIRVLFKLDRLRLICTDTRIRSDIDIGMQDSLLDQEMKGGGGTDFMDIFNTLEKDPPTLLVFFTDMNVYFNFSPPSFPIVWINSYDNCTAPKEYGQTILATGEK